MFSGIHFSRVLEKRMFSTTEQEIFSKIDLHFNVTDRM